ncbi:MAG: 50S ribosomal protein L21 [bacterium]
MYAIVEIAGRQFKVSRDQVVRVPRIDVEIGSKLTFEDVRLLKSNDDTLVGSPVVEGARVIADVLGHGKSEKVVVYKYRRRKYYRRKRGHRQPYTEIKISEIRLEG